MIIWISSYPKSGNTIVRSLLSSYFFSKDGNFDFDLLNNIRQFPDFSLFEKLKIDTTNEKEVVKNYINYGLAWFRKNNPGIKISSIIKC
jgi:hypothetical protein